MIETCINAPKGYRISEYNLNDNNSITVKYKPLKFKKGNFLIGPNTTYAIFSEYNINGKTFSTIWDTNNYGSGLYIKDYRLANTEEQQTFLRILRDNYHLNWNSETFKLCPWFYIPNMGDTYYTIELSKGDVTIKDYIFRDTSIDFNRIMNNLCYKTFDDAKKYVIKLGKLLRNENY